MAYIVTIGQQNYTLSVMEQNEQQETLILDGITHHLDWQQITSLIADSSGKSQMGGRYSLLIGGASHEVFARRLQHEESGLRYEIILAGQRFELTIEDERSKQLAGVTKADSSANSASVQAPMPGLVINLPFTVGASVKEGQTVAVLEAMKMENDLASPISGTVKELLVQAGQTVEQGQRLVIIEKEIAR